MTSLIHPCYFGSIAQWAVIAQSEHVIFEMHDNYQKQTYRNRLLMYGANGILQLNIPVKRDKSTDQKLAYKDIQIAYDEDWQTQHWRSLVTAYKTSPFFEYYQDDLHSLYHKKHNFLMDFNMLSFEVLEENLGLDLETSKTTAFEKTPAEEIVDMRTLAKAKKGTNFELTHYNQVFEERHGHYKNLCILDLLFNEGPNTINYLEDQKVVLL